MSVAIRIASRDDFDAVYTFVNQLENETFDRLRQEIIYLKNIQHPSYIYLIAFIEAQPVGFVSCHAQELLHHSGLIGEIQEMFVSEKFRSARIGSKLMEELKQIASRRGILQLEVTSNKMRSHAHRFYVKEGFSESHLKFTLSL
jgi:(aminoalkyl)phosphonate N-acetyltransferase